MNTASTVYALGPGTAPGTGTGTGTGTGPGSAVSARPCTGPRPFGDDPVLFLLTRGGGGRAAAGPTRRAW